LGVPLWVGLFAHTAQALATRPVSAAIPHATPLLIDWSACHGELVEARRDIEPVCPPLLAQMADTRVGRGGGMFW